MHQYEVMVESIQTWTREVKDEAGLLGIVDKGKM